MVNVSIYLVYVKFALLHSVFYVFDMHVLCMKLYIIVYDTSILNTTYVRKRTYRIQAEQKNCSTKKQEKHKNVDTNELKRSFK